MKRIYLTTIVLGAIAFASCKKEVGTGVLVTEEIYVTEDFTAIENRIAADVLLTQGLNRTVILEGHQNILDEIDVEFDDDEITIKPRRFNSNVDWSHVKVHITLPELMKLDLKGSGRFVANYPFTLDKLEIEQAGNGQVIFNKLNVDRLESEILGNGDLEIGSGSCRRLILEMKGNGDFEGRDFVSTQADIHISGSGSAVVNVTEYMKAKITGSGDILYYGNPRIDSEITGSGTLRSR